MRHHYLFIDIKNHLTHMHVLHVTFITSMYHYIVISRTPLTHAVLWILQCVVTFET